MIQTPGQRVYLIRLARGDGVKNPETLRSFAKALEAQGYAYDPSSISRTENGDRDVTIPDCVAFAAVDPLKRKPEWVAFGDATPHVETKQELAAMVDPSRDHRATEEELDRDERIVAGKRHVEKLAAKKATKRKTG